MTAQHPTPDEAFFYRSDTRPGLELMRAHWVRHTFPKHFHDCYTIGINDAGAGTFHCRHRNEEAVPGALNLIEPGEMHTGAARGSQGWAYRDFYISVELMRDLASQVEVGALPIFPRPTVFDAQTASDFRVAFGALSVHVPCLEEDYLLLKAIRALLARHGGSLTQVKIGNERNAVDRVRQYLHAHYAEKITMTALSAIIQSSPYHLIRTFHREIGMPPHAYQNVLRVNKAQKQLRAGVEIAQVAIGCGFYDQSHMNRMFRRVLGITPGAYRS